MINRLLKWILFLFEGFLAIPILGGAFILALHHKPLYFEGVIHLIALILLLVSGRKKIAGNIMGIITAILGWIPVVGWLLHLVTAIILLVEGITFHKKKPFHNQPQNQLNNYSQQNPPHYH